MIIAQQVEDSMDQEAPEFLAKPVPEFNRLTPSRRRRNHDIAQQHGWFLRLREQQRGQIYFSRRKINLSPFHFIHRKRQHISRPVFVPVPAIEGAHAPTGDQLQAELRLVSARGRQDSLGCPAQPRPIDRHHALTILQDDGHGDQ